jgi:hypothetical protein
LTALAPVHVGDGDFLLRDVDFLEEEGKTFLLDVERFFELMALSPGALDEWGSGRGDVRRILERMRVRPERIACRTIPGRIGAPRVFTYLRNGTGEPLVPGSALKGALRTLVVWALAFDFDEKTRDWVSSREAASALGSAVDHGGEWDEGPALPVERALLAAPAARREGLRGHGGDLLRCLGVGDCRLREADLEVARARVLTATPEGPAWKAADRAQKPRPRPDDPQAAAVGVEAMRPGAQGELILRLDGLFELLRGAPGPEERRVFEAARAALDFEPWRIDIPFQVAVHSRNFGLAVCYRERRFFEERKLYDLARFYVELEQQIQKAAGGEAIFARVGWGGGWEAMTGGIAAGKFRDRARQRFGLGREGFAFPKSRKVALEGARPARPFGWVRLDPV